MSVVLAALHAAGWSIYVGGALTMELVWRHAQKTMHPSQVAVVCQRAGRRYRWCSLAALVTLLATGIPRALEHDRPFDLGHPFGRMLSLLVLLWLVQLALLAVLATSAHPSMHARAAPDMSAEEARLERQRVGAAIRRMDRLLRVELAGALLALVVGAMLHDQRVL